MDEDSTEDIPGTHKDEQGRLTANMMGNAIAGEIESSKGGGSGP